jgi:hypothetical protein
MSELELIDVDGCAAHICGDDDDPLLGLCFYADGEPMCSMHLDLEDAEELLSLLANNVAKLRQRVGAKLS